MFIFIIKKCHKIGYMYVELNVNRDEMNMWRPDRELGSRAGHAASGATGVFDKVSRQGRA